MTTRTTPPTPGDAELQRLRTKLSRLIGERRYSEAIRLRQQALQRYPDQPFRHSLADLWCLEGQQALSQGQIKRAESALTTAISLGLHGEPLYLLTRHWLGQGRPERALELWQKSFEGEQLPPEYAGAYLKLLLITGQEQRVQQLLCDCPQRFQAQQIHWAAGILNLLAGDASNARHQFDRMVAPASPGDHAAVWVAWAALQAGDPEAAAQAIGPVEHPACEALALHLAAEKGERPATPPDRKGGPSHKPELAAGLELLHHLKRKDLLRAGLLLLRTEGQALVATQPALAALRRTLLVLAGQQALEQQEPEDAIRCWQGIVDQPAFDPDLALRLYPLLDQENDGAPEAEHLARSLLNWVRHSARKSPADWPEPLLSLTLARLHCWQADQQMRRGGRQQAVQSVEQARKLAPALPDVIGRQGMLAYLDGRSDAAVPLLWQSLEGGCRSCHIYEILDEILEESGETAERRRLEREYGAALGMTTEADLPSGMAPDWLLALSSEDVLGLGSKLTLCQNSDAAAQALVIFVDEIRTSQAGKDGSLTLNLRKVTLNLEEVSGRWDALIAPLTLLEQATALTALLVAMQRFCRRSKTLASQITIRQQQLEQLARDTGTPHGDRALTGLLLLLGLRLKRSESPDEEAAPLLRMTSQPERLLPLALLDLRLLASTAPWRPMVTEMRRRDPQNPLLTLALASMERCLSFRHQTLSEMAFEQARLQQDSQALAACRREEWWAEQADSLRRGKGQAGEAARDSIWQEFSREHDLRSILRRAAEQHGMEDFSEAHLDAMLPELERHMKTMLNQMNPLPLMFPGDESEESEGGKSRRAARPDARRHTFMDL